MREPTASLRAWPAPEREPEEGELRALVKAASLAVPAVHDQVSQGCNRTPTCSIRFHSASSFTAHQHGIRPGLGRPGQHVEASSPACTMPRGGRRRRSCSARRICTCRRRGGEDRPGRLGVTSGHGLDRSRERGLKHRADNETRTIPIPPQLVWPDQRSQLAGDGPRSASRSGNWERPRGTGRPFSPGLRTK